MATVQATDSELDGRTVRRGLVGLEVLPLLELERPGEEHGRELLDLGVVVEHAVVVELPRVGDPVLGGGQLLLQLQEVLVGLEVGVGLAEGEQRLAARRSAGCRPGPAPAGCAALRSPMLRAWMTASSVVLLVGGVALHGLDQVGDEVEPALQLHVDLRPGVLDLVAPADQAVVGGDQRTRSASTTMTAMMMRSDPHAAECTQARGADLARTVAAQRAAARCRRAAPVERHVARRRGGAIENSLRPAASPARAQPARRARRSPSTASQRGGERFGVAGRHQQGVDARRSPRCGSRRGRWRPPGCRPPSPRAAPRRTTRRAATARRTRRRRAAARTSRRR